VRGVEELEGLEGRKEEEVKVGVWLKNW